MNILFAVVLALFVHGVIRTESAHTRPEHTIAVTGYRDAQGNIHINAASSPQDVSVPANKPKLPDAWKGIPPQ